MDRTAANQIIADALKDARVSSLYASVDGRSPITVVPSVNGIWSSATEATETTIEVASTSFPAECLYHELLHADLKLSGYRQYRTHPLSVALPGT